MGKGQKQTFLQRRYRKGPQAQEKITITAGMQNKTTTRHHFTSINRRVGEDVEKLEPLCTAGGKVNGITARKTAWRLLEKLKIELQYALAISLLGIPTEIESRVLKRYLYTHISGSATHKGEKVGATEASISG